MKKHGLTELYEKHIRGTQEKAIVVDTRILLCHLSVSAMHGAGIATAKIYISSRTVKHLYDKKPAEEFAFLVEYLYKLVKVPDSIYENKGSKRGTICLVKRIKGKNYMCSIEMIKRMNDKGEEIEENHIATAFRIRDDAYLKDYKLLWSWKDGNPSS